MIACRNHVVNHIPGNSDRCRAAERYCDRDGHRTPANRSYGQTFAIGKHCCDAAPDVDDKTLIPELGGDQVRDGASCLDRSTAEGLSDTERNELIATDRPVVVVLRWKRWLPQWK